MNYDAYLDLIEQEKYQEATAYRSSCIPDTLYKYFTLDDNADKNEMRLSTLKRGEIYLSTLDQFNDPFEGKAFVFEDEPIAPWGFRRADYQTFIDHINSHSRICCFANPEEKHQNMPMWAYYANNHRGFCVEYQMSAKQKKFLYPVSYGPERVVGNAFIGNLVMGIIDMVKAGKDSSEMPGDVSVYNHLAYLSLTCKHISWRHEKEVRALVPVNFGNFFPAIPSKIYIGMNCSAEHEATLVEIAHQFRGCQVIKMQKATEQSNFFLGEERLV